MKVNLRHIGLVVNDFQPMIKFYSYFGFKNPKYKEEDVDFYKDMYCYNELSFFDTYKMILDNDNIMLELVHYTNINIDKKNLWNFGFSHIAFTIDNLDKLYNDLKQKGVKFLSAPTLHPEKIVKLCFCEDPEGNLLELVEEIK